MVEGGARNGISGGVGVGGTVKRGRRNGREGWEEQ